MKSALPPSTNRDVPDSGSAAGVDVRGWTNGRLVTVDAVADAGSGTEIVATRRASPLTSSTRTTVVPCPSD